MLSINLYEFIEKLNLKLALHIMIMLSQVRIWNFIKKKRS